MNKVTRIMTKGMFNLLFVGLITCLVSFSLFGGLMVFSSDFSFFAKVSCAIAIAFVAVDGITVVILCYTSGKKALASVVNELLMPTPSNTKPLI